MATRSEVIQVTGIRCERDGTGPSSPSSAPLMNMATMIRRYRNADTTAVSMAMIASGVLLASTAASTA